MKKIVHLLWTGGVGGIEKLCLTIGTCNPNFHEFWFVHEGGIVYEQMVDKELQVKLFNYKNTNVIRLCKQIKSCESNIEAIIIHHDATMLWCGALILKAMHFDPPIYIYAHCAYSDFINSKGKKMVFHYAALFCDGIIAISDSVKKSILKNENIKSEKIAIVYNGIDLKKFTRIVNSNDKFVIAFVGRLIYQKGIQLLIEALNEISNKIEYKCYIVGDGPERTTLEKKVEIYRLQDKIIFLGNRIDIPNILQNSTIFIHPAIWEEGFGITLIEAMSCGIPCIAFRKGAIPEYIKDGVNGFIVNDISSEHLADEILKVYQLWESKQIDTVALNARKTAENFSCEKTEESIRELVLRKKGK